VGNVNGIGRGGTNVVKVRSESGADGGMSEVLFYHTELALSTAFSPIKFNSLVLYHLKFALVCSVPVDVSNNPRILEIYDSIVDEESRGRERVKDVEVVIFNPRTVEIGSGMCPCMEGNGVLRVASLMNSYKVSIHTDLSVSDISHYLILTILIEEDKWILPRITVVILAPPVSWMVWVIELLSKLRDVVDGARCGGEGNGGVILSEPNWFIALHVVI